MTAGYVSNEIRRDVFGGIEFLNKNGNMSLFHLFLRKEK